MAFPTPSSDQLTRCDYHGRVFQPRPAIVVVLSDIGSPASEEAEEASAFLLRRSAIDLIERPAIFGCFLVQSRHLVEVDWLRPLVKWNLSQLRRV